MNGLLVYRVSFSLDRHLIGISFHVHLHCTILLLVSVLRVCHYCHWGLWLLLYSGIVVLVSIFSASDLISAISRLCGCLCYSGSSAFPMIQSNETEKKVHLE
jgi:hypothetical protein